MFTYQNRFQSRNSFRSCIIIIISGIDACWSLYSRRGVWELSGLLSLNVFFVSMQNNINSKTIWATVSFHLIHSSHSIAVPFHSKIVSSLQLWTRMRMRMRMRTRKIAAKQHSKWKWTFPKGLLIKIACNANSIVAINGHNVTTGQHTNKGDSNQNE